MTNLRSEMRSAPKPKRRSFARARKMAGYSRESLAEHLGVDRTTVARWEAGEYEPQPWQRPRIAEAFELSTCEIKQLLDEFETQGRTSERSASLVGADGALLTECHELVALLNETTTNYLDDRYIIKGRKFIPVFVGLFVGAEAASAVTAGGPSKPNVLSAVATQAPEVASSGSRAVRCESDESVFLGEGVSPDADGGDPASVRLADALGVPREELLSMLIREAEMQDKEGR